MTPRNWLQVFCKELLTLQNNDTLLDVVPRRVVFFMHMDGLVKPDLLLLGRFRMFEDEIVMLHDCL